VRLCPTCQRSFIDLQTVCPLDDARLAPSDDLGDLAFLGGSAVRLGRVLGSYRLIGVLGEGGMGTVYVAAHTRLDRYVAIKMLRPELAARRDSAPRLLDEARTVNRIEHPNIVESIDVVEDPQHGVYSVLELLHGPDLKTVLTTGRLSLASTLRVATQIADALSAVHAVDIVHRDLKPDNMILIDRDGRSDFVKLIDFGVSKAGDDAGALASGTAAYMAPEQAAGGRVDGRADLYALGVLIFEMATGRHPFPSTTDDEYIMRHAGDAPPRPSAIDPRVPPALDAVILRCLAKSPADRFASAGEVATALRAIPAPQDAAVPVRTRSTKWIAVAAGVAIAASLGIVAMTRGASGRDATVATSALASAAAVTVTGHRATEPIGDGTDVAGPTAATDGTPGRPGTAMVATVEIAFDSIPDGALVYRIGETVPLGTTPFTTSFARSTDPVRVRFALANFAPVELEVLVDASREAAVALAPLARAPAKKAPAKQVHREGVMDPFAR